MTPLNIVFNIFNIIQGFPERRKPQAHCPFGKLASENFRAKSQVTKLYL